MNQVRCGEIARELGKVCGEIAHNEVRCGEIAHNEVW